ncbi:hypothetical protein HK097_002400, partial [Rhizophlyctis rosea]
MRKKSNWRKALKTPTIPSQQNSDEDDIPLSDDDMALFHEYGAHTQFLRNLNPESLVKNEIHTGSRAIMRAKGGIDIASSSDESENDEEDGEHDWESRPRVVKKEWKDAHDEAQGKGQRLPIKMVDGTVVKVKSNKADGLKEDSDKMDVDDVKEEEESGEEDVPKPTTKKSKKSATTAESKDQQPPKSKQERRVEAQEKLAEAASL